MAQRRMFSPKITSTDIFLDMPVSARELYFQLGMNADDDGFITPKRIMKMIGASEDDLKVLIAKKFVIPFESGVVVITSWRINNLIRKDWYQETIYKDEKAQLTTKSNGDYQLVNENVPKSLTEVRLGKVSIGNKESMSASADDLTPFEEFWKAYPKKELKKKSRDIWKNKKLDGQLDEILVFLEKAKQTDRWKKGMVKQPTTFLNNECWNDDLEAYADSQPDNEAKVYKI